MEIYRDGNKSPETKINYKEYAHSSKTEQASVWINNDTSPISSHYTDLVACIECMWTIKLWNNISHNKYVTAIYIVWWYRAGVIVNSEACSVLLLCAYSLLNLVSGLLLPSLYLHFLIQRIFSLLVYSLFLPLHLQLFQRARMRTKK